MREYIVQQIHDIITQEVCPQLSKAKARVVEALLILGCDTPQAELAEWLGTSQPNINEHLMNRKTDSVHLYDRLKIIAESTELRFWLRMLKRYPDNSSPTVDINLLPWRIEKRWGRGVRIFVAPGVRGKQFKSKRNK